MTGPTDEGIHVADVAEALDGPISDGMGLVPLCSARLTIAAARRVGDTPFGCRLIGETADGRFTGRLSGSVVGVASDWMTVAPDGTGLIDARLLLETDDGALIAITYRGRTSVTADMSAPIYVAPLMETADPRYRWVNTVQAAGRGRVRGRVLEYDIYELR